MSIPTLLWMIGVHAGAIWACWHFTWTAYLIFWVLTIFTGLGVTVGYHRMLTHGSFETSSWLRFGLTFLGQLAGQGTPLFWVTHHRKHHNHSDRPHDPHSPRHGIFWAHCGWLLSKQNPLKARFNKEHYAPDILCDPNMDLLSMLYWPSHIALAGLLYGLGGLSWFLWGMCARLATTYHMTWSVNSVAHWIGSRPWVTRDDSRNVAVLAPFTFGESWHNNHHAHPVAANHGPLWLDPSYQVIKGLEKLGLVWGVKHEPAHEWV